MKHEIFVYRETILLNGEEKVVRFDNRNRRVVKAFTEDTCVDIEWNDHRVKTKGPRGTEVYVDFVLL